MTTLPFRRSHRPLRIAGAVPVILLASCAVSFSQPLYVEYPANTLPSQDPNAPWAELGHDGVLAVAQGVLTAIDPDLSAWVLMHRFEPSLPTHPIIQVEARVRVPSGNGITGSPALALYDYDASRPPGDIAHLWYQLDLFPNVVEFAKYDNDAGAIRTLFASIPVPDLSSEFHLIRMTREEAATSQSFQILIDGVLAATVTGEPMDRPLDGVGFGYGMERGVGESQWDVVRYWSEEPVAVTATTWGRIKAHLR